MIASETHIIYTDGSEKLYIYDLQLNLNDSRTINAAAKSLSGIFYNQADKTIYVASLRDNIYILNYTFDVVDRITLKLNEPVFIDFNKKEHSLYIANSTSILKYSIDSENKTKADISGNGKIVAFFCDDSEFIYSFFTTNTTNTISIDKFGSESPFNCIQNYFTEYTHAFLDSKNNLVIAISYEKRVYKLMVLS
jgi:hypothetical protein